MKTHLIKSTKAITAIAFLAGGIAVTVPAVAITTSADIVTTTIDVRDLETDHGVARIYKTLERRAKAACWSTGAKSIRTRVLEKDCAKDLLIDFVQNVDDARLTNYHQKMQS